jgi:hypothetical protein
MAFDVVPQQPHLPKTAGTPFSLEVVWMPAPRCVKVQMNTIKSP